MKLISDLLSFLLPRTCPACRSILHDWEDCLCLRCQANLPLTRFQDQPDNPLEEMFWGRVRLEQAVAWFFFRKGSAYQEVLHRLKYENRPDIGYSLGRQFGFELRHSRGFIRPDLLVPVPLHPRKFRKRGYNQSERIAAGLAAGLELPVDATALARPVVTDTQTKKNKYDRYLNVSGKFRAEAPARLQGKHILLVDDVVTTGATLEACAEELLRITGVRVSIAALAWARTG